MHKKIDAAARGYDEAFGIRLKSVIKRIGSLVKSGEVAGVTDEQISAWRDGRSKMPFHGASKLCQAAGVSLNWLSTGEGGQDLPDQQGTTLDKEHLIVAVQTVEELANKQDLRFNPEKKADLIFSIYESITAKK